MYHNPLQNHLTPLYAAAFNGHCSVVECLVTSGANVNAVGNVSFFLTTNFIAMVLYRISVLLYTLLLTMVIVQ